MSDTNVVILIGHTTSDIKVSYSSVGTAIGKFGIAVNKEYTAGGERKKEVNFFDVTMFGKTVEALSQYLVKGKMVAIAGELKQSRWGKDGQTRSKVEIIANNIQLLGGGQQQKSELREEDYGF